MTARRLTGEDRRDLLTRLERLLEAADGTREHAALASLALRVRVLLDEHYPLSPPEPLDRLHRGPRPAPGEPSARQLDVLKIIVRQHGRGVPPTYREIGDELGIRAVNGVADHVEALIGKGLVKRRQAGQARCLVPTHRGRITVREAKAA